MEEFLIIILVALIATILLGKAESVQLFDEIFGEGWWDNDKAEEWHKLTLEFGQIESNSTDQNLPLTESDHSGQIEITSNENIAEDEQKRKIIVKFLAIKDEFKKKGKFSAKEWNQIDGKIAKHLKVSRAKIYKWKKEFGLCQERKMHNIEEKKDKRKHLIYKFDQMKAELKRDGFKNSYDHEIDKTVAKELDLSFTTINNWKRKLGQTESNKHSDSEQKELMKLYYEIKALNPKIIDEEIAKMLKIGKRTLFRWKKLFKRQQFHPNLVDDNFVEENAGRNVQEFENSNSGSI